MKDIKVSTKNSKDTLLKIKNVSKSFGHVQALSKVNFELYPAEVLALVGDNGAGKSTLIKILSGVYNPDHGEIYINGQSVLIKNPSQANKIGIASVYQDLALVDVFNVAENIYLGMEPMWKGLFINYRKMKNDAQSALKLIRINIPSLKTLVSDLSGGQRQSVAIARSLVRGGSIFLLDEPTAALGVEQTAKVNEIISDLRANGKSVIVISHNLEHVFQVADRICVLRRGELVKVKKKQETTREEIVGLITGAIEG